MPSKKDITFRVAVGSETGPRSATWRIWAQDKTKVPNAKSDVYIAMRSQVGVWKTSLHQTGDWRTALISEYFEKEKGGPILGNRPSRIMQRWTKPIYDSDKWSIALKIVIPNSELTIIPGGRVEDLDTIWLPYPPENTAIVILIIFAEQNLQPNIENWPSRFEFGTNLIGYISLTNGETVWIVYTMDIFPNELSQLRRTFALQNLPPNIVEKVNNDETDSNWMTIFFTHDDEDGPRQLTEIALKKKNS